MCIRDSSYPIGEPGQKWQQAERQAWFAQRTVKREYQQEVVPKIQALADRFDIEQYGALSYDEARFPLFAIKSKNWDESKPTILVTGGVHGYETSGVHGAIKFAATQAEQYAAHFNIVVAPCVSPWGYEVINRWNPNAVDPNRSFYDGTPAEESANLRALVAFLPEETNEIPLIFRKEIYAMACVAGGTAFVFLQDVLSFEWNVVATICLIIAIRIIVIKFKLGLSGIDDTKRRIFTKLE